MCIRDSFDAEVLETSGGTAVCSAMSARLNAAVDNGCAPGPAAIVIRPERVTVQLADDPVPSGYNAIGGTVTEIVYLGASTQVHVDVGESSALVVDVPNHSGPQSVGYATGMGVTCVCAPDAVRVLRASPASVSAATTGHAE